MNKQLCEEDALCECIEHCTLHTHFLNALGMFLSDFFLSFNTFCVCFFEWPLFAFVSLEKKITFQKALKGKNPGRMAHLSILKEGNQQKKTTNKKKLFDSRVVLMMPFVSIRTKKKEHRKYLCDVILSYGFLSVAAAAAAALFCTFSIAI